MNISESTLKNDLLPQSTCTTSSRRCHCPLRLRGSLSIRNKESNSAQTTSQENKIQAKCRTKYGQENETV